MTELQNRTPLVSIVVPAYKVEEYLKQCLQSIADQTYQNIEILVIDDGSPDRSGAIADEFAKNEPRLRVIHTENRGVSSARNTGIDESKGQYIAFVDSDDRLMPDFVEYMLGIIRKTGAYFAMSRNCFRSPDEPQSVDDRIEVYSPSRAAADLLYPYIDIGCWNKLFDRSFLVDKALRFPVKFFMGEGLNFIVSAAQLSNHVGVGLRKVYYYRKDNLNSATTKAGVDKFINALAAIDNIEKNLLVHSEELETALHFHRYLTTFYALYAIVVTGTEKHYTNEYRQWAFSIRNDALRMMKAKVSIRMKLRLLMHAVSPRFVFQSRNALRQFKRRILSQTS